MFFRELLSLDNYDFSKKLISEIDKWLAFLPKVEKESITASKIASKFDVDYSICESLLLKLEDLGLIEENYIIMCPECERVIEVVDKENLLEKLEDIKYCIKCDEEIELTLTDVYRSYKLIKKPSASENDIREYTKTILEVERNISNISQDDSINKLLTEGKKDVNDFFTSPLKRKRKKL